MITDFLSVNDARWREFLAHARHDAYHLPEYLQVAANYERGEPVAFYAEDGDQALLMPLLMRELPADLGAPENWRDVISPYGYPGPITTHGAGRDLIDHSLRSLRDLARERDVLTAFVRLHPLCSMAAGHFANVGSVVHHGPVVYVDLTKTRDQWNAETRLDHRRNIARLIRLGYTVEMDNWTAYPDFRAVYRATMERLSAVAFYNFSDRYFDDLRALVGDHLHLCTVRGPAGDVAASGLFLLADRIAEFHLGGSAACHFPKAPSKLMFDFVRRWAKDRGATVLNLGGGIGGVAGSLHRFKSGFSPLVADFHTVRIIFDDDRYRQLTAARGIPLVAGETSGFFPQYRRPPNAAAGV